MKLHVLQGNDQSSKFVEKEGQSISAHFALFDNFSKGKRTYQIDHVLTGTTICRRTFATTDVAVFLCELYETAWGELLNQSSLFLKADLEKNPTMAKLLAYKTSLLLEEADNPVTFSKLAKAKRQASKDLGA
jgi:hypothetical protein